MKKTISLILALGLMFGIAGPAVGENRLVPALGITQGVADGLYVNDTGDTMSGQLKIDLSGLPLYLVNSTDNASNEVLRLYSNRATPANGDKAFINFNLNTTAPAETTFGRIIVEAEDASSPGNGAFLIELLEAGSLVGYLSISAAQGLMTIDFLDVNITGGNVRIDNSKFYGFTATTVPRISMFADGGTGALRFTNMSSATSFFQLTSATASVNANACRMENFNTIYIEAQAAVQFPGVIGIDFLPGSDIDTDLITVGVTGTPRWWWDESADLFAFTKNIIIPDAATATEAMNRQTSDARYLGVGSSKAGTVAGGSFAGNPKIFTVTFGTAFPDTNYAVTITAEDNRTFTFQTKLAASFVMNSNANLALVGDVDWTATAHNDP